MKIKTITYQRVKNLGNHESKRLEMIADVSDGEDPIIAFNVLEDFVDTCLDREAEERYRSLAKNEDDNVDTFLASF
jgi:hypothetical protein